MIAKQADLSGDIEDLTVHRVDVSRRQMILSAESNHGEPRVLESNGLHCFVDAVSEVRDATEHFAVASGVLNDEDDVGSSWDVIRRVKGDTVEFVELLTVEGWYFASDCQHGK